MSALREYEKTAELADSEWGRNPDNAGPLRGYWEATRDKLYTEAGRLVVAYGSDNVPSGVQQLYWDRVDDCSARIARLQLRIARR